MANTRQAKKRVRQNEKRRLANASKRSKLRTSIKSLRKTIAGNNASEAQSQYRTTVSVIDSMASKGIIHRNTADRYKKRLNQQVKTLVLGES